MRFLLVALLLWSCKSAPNASDVRVIHGTPDSEHKFVIKLNPGCTGNVYKRNVVLSAAHCYFDWRTQRKKSVSVTTKSGGVALPVEAYFHEDFAKLFHDAKTLEESLKGKMGRLTDDEIDRLRELKKQAVAKDFVAFVFDIDLLENFDMDESDLPTLRSIAPNTEISIIGFGLIDEDGTRGNGRTIGHNRLNRIEGDLGVYTSAAAIGRHVGGSGAGDSGGAVVIKGTLNLVGVNGWGMDREGFNKVGEEFFPLLDEATTQEVLDRLND